MAKLGVWSISSPSSENSSQESEPKRVGHGNVGLEKNLEDWIVRDVSLIGEGLTLVGRQLTIDEGRLDLLAIDTRDRWVVIELKAGKLDFNAVTQALYYASTLAMLTTEDFCEKLCNQFIDEKNFRWKIGEQFKNQEAFRAKVRNQLENEGGEREITLMLVGTGTSANLERITQFLGRFGIPIEIVTFEVFKLDSGQQLLVREVIEEPLQPPRLTRKRTVEAVRELAREAGVLKPLDRLIEVSKQTGLAVQPQLTSIRIAPQADKRRLVLYVEPQLDARSGGNGMLFFHWNPDALNEFFGIDEQEVERGLGKLAENRAYGGDELDRCIVQIEQFLEKLQKAEPNSV